MPTKPHLYSTTHQTPVGDLTRGVRKLLVRYRKRDVIGDPPRRRHIVS